MKVRLLTASLKIGTMAISLLAFSFLTAMAQTPNVPITVATDKLEYSDGNIIKISGTVTDQLNIPISIVIKDSSQKIVYIAQTNVNSDNTYSTQAIAGGDIWKSAGTYEIDVTYGGKDRTSKTTFEFTTSGQPSSSNIGNQTNATQVIPEFGSLSVSIFALSILVAIISYTRSRHSINI